MQKYKFRKEHEWISNEERNIVKIGISDYAQKSFGDIIYIGVIKPGYYFKTDIIGTIESIKTASDICTPISGEVIQFNTNLLNHPEIINSDPYGNGWIVKMKIDNSDLNDSEFMTYEEYQRFLDSFLDEKKI